MNHDDSVNETLRLRLDSAVRSPQFSLLNNPNALQRAAGLGTFRLGLFPDSEKQLSAERNSRLISDVHQWISGNCTEELRKNAVLLDTTTLFTVYRLLHDQIPPSAEHLFDLATFVTGVVLFDHVFHLKNPDLPPEFYAFINKGLNENVVVPLDVYDSPGTKDLDGETSLGAILTGLWKGSVEYFDELSVVTNDDPQNDLSREIRTAWETVLGVRLWNNSWLFGRVDDLGERLERWDTPVPDLLRASVSVLEPERNGTEYRDRSPDTRSAHVLANKSNQRSIFNLNLAGMLGLPYLAGWSRVPIRNAYFRRVKEARRSLRTASYVDQSYQQRFEWRDSNPVELRLPLFLAAVLDRTETLGEFLAALAAIRSAAARFRTHRSELDEAIDSRDSATCDRLDLALRQDAHSLVDHLQSFSQAVIVSTAVEVICTNVAVGETEKLAVSGLALLGASVAVAHEVVEIVDRLKERLLKTDRWFLADVSQAADGLTRALPKVRSLWHISANDDTRFIERFDRLRTLRYC